MDGSFEIREYLEGGRSQFSEWFNRLDAVTAERVDTSVGWKQAILAMSSPSTTACLNCEWISALATAFTLDAKVGRLLSCWVVGVSAGRVSDIAVAVKRWKRYQQLRT